MIHIVLPAYNEVNSLRILLPGLIATLKEENLKYKIYVVDDGSSDNTSEVAKLFKQKKVKLIKHHHNLGLAEAINSGFREAIKLAKSDDVIITMDADNTHLPGLIVRMVRLIREGNDVVISSRFITGARIKGVPLFRRILSRAGSLLFRLLFPIAGIRDYTCGYRAYRMGIIKRAIGEYGENFIDQKGFSCMVDILLKLHKFNPICTEVPMILRYDQKEGKSKMHVKSTIFETFSLIITRMFDGKWILNRYLMPICFILIFLLSRLINISGLPLFSDEAYAILQARDLHFGAPLLRMIKNTTQPIFIWIIALFQYLPISLIASARLVSVLAGLVTALILARISSQINGKNTYWAAFGVITALPFTLFYDRTALFESLTLMWMAWSLIIPVLAIPLGILTKQIAWLSLPLALVYHFKNKKKILLTILFTFVLPLAVWIIALGGWDKFQETIFNKTSAPLSLTANFKGNIFRVKLWFLAYLTWPIILTVIIGFGKEIIKSWRRRRVNSLTLIGSWCLAIIVFESLTARIFYPRYLYPVVIGVVLLSVSGIMVIDSLIGKILKKSLVRKFLMFLIILGLGYQEWKTDLNIIFKPAKAAIALEDRFQFFEDWTSGVGTEEMAKKIEQIAKKSNKGVTVYFEEENLYFVGLKFDKRLNGMIFKKADWLIDPLSEIPEEILNQTEDVLFVRNRHPDIPFDWPVELIASIEKSASRKVFLYRLLKGK